MNRRPVLLALALTLCTVGATALTAGMLTGAGKARPTDRAQLTRVTAQETINFESVAPGTIVETVFGSLGSGPVALSGHNNNLDLRFAGPNNAAVVFDSAAPPGIDFDLGTPNQNFGGPGIGAGGASGTYANTVARGHILVVNEDTKFVDRDGNNRITNLDSPVTQTNDAEIVGSSIAFDFSALGTVTIYSVLLVDNEALEPNIRVELYGAGGGQIGATIVGPHTGNNGVFVLPLGPTSGVRTMIVRLDSSGAIDDVVFTRDAACGDGIVNAGEQCDDGNQNDLDACGNDCLNNVCGDGVVNNGEQCDDGNQVDVDACGNDCLLNFCGNGTVEAGEQCDDGNQIDTDACGNDCLRNGCGDGVVNNGEQCDDGNTSNLDACLNDCSNARCGDGYVYTGAEQCDDGNNVGGDGCEADCTLCTGRIGDCVWNDGVVGMTCDGIQDAGQCLNGISGLEVRLLDSQGTLVRTTATGLGAGGDGYYQFMDLCAGSYTVEVDTPLGKVVAPSLVGDPATDSNGSPASVTVPANSSSEQTIDFGFCTEPAGGEGCTPGYWKVPQHHDSWTPTGYGTTMLVGSVFTAANAAFPTLADDTLVQALGYPGGRDAIGAAQILLRAAVASLLNSSHPDVDFDRLQTDVISSVNAALASGNRSTMLTLATSLDRDNNDGCPLN